MCLRGNEMNACAVCRKSEMANGTRSALSANATLRPFSRCRSRNHSPKGIHTSRACICVPYVHKWCLYVVSHIYVQNLRHMYMLLISPVVQRGRMHHATWNALNACAWWGKEAGTGFGSHEPSNAACIPELLHGSSRNTFPTHS